MQIENLSDTKVSRRRFITLASAGAAVAALDVRGFMASPLTSDGDDLTLTLVDPDSQLNLVFVFIDLDHDIAGNRLVAAPGGTPRMRIELGSQHTAEAATTGGVPGTAPIAHHNAGPSRLVFDVAPPIDLSVASLLNLAAFTLRTNGGQDATEQETRIELPTDLRWTPSGEVSIVSESGPVSPAGVGQLHRLRLDATDGIGVLPLFNVSQTDPFPTRIPNSSSRNSIVAAAGINGPAVADHVRLTSQGAWASINADWPGVSWTQRVQGGRDQFAQVVERGILMPFGHEAVWTQTNHRVWTADTAGNLVSTLVNEEYFAVSGDPDRPFPGPFSPNSGRTMPFRTVTITEDDNISARKRPIGAIDIGDAWVVERNAPGTIWDGYEARMSYRGTDSVGNEPYPFSLQAVFVTRAGLAKPSVRNQLAAFYASTDGERARTIFGGVRDLAWVEPKVAGDRSTTVRTFEMTIDMVPITGVSTTDLAAAGQLALQPVITAGRVVHDGISDIPVIFTPEFVESGNDEAANPSLAFLDLVTPTDLPVGKEARAVMTPDIKAEQFNQTIGIAPRFEPSSGAPDAPADTWDPTKSFGSAAAILGNIKLADLVLPVLFDSAIAGIDIPGFAIERFPDRIEQSYRWCPPNIEPVPAAGFVVTPDTALCVEISSVVGLVPEIEASATVEFEVTDFTLLVPPDFGPSSPLIELDISRLSAVQTTTGVPDMTFDVEAWRLRGILEAFEPLLDLLTPGGSAFDIDISSVSIDLDLSMSLPNISLGVLKITNFSIGLGGSFPFTGGGEPRIAIGVGSRANPVSLQILQFGGGFSCELELSPKGLELLVIKAFVSARLVEIDIVIAEAYCEVAISAVFKLKGGEATFIGELSLTARFSVLGLVGATLSIVGRVKYNEAAQTVTISGTIYWSVTAVFTYSGSVPIASIDIEVGDGASAGLRRKVSAGALSAGGGGSDRSGSFAEAHTLASWNKYVDAFAEEN